MSPDRYVEIRWPDGFDRARLPTLHTRLNKRAHQRAMHELRDRHRDEYDDLLDRNCLEMGVLPHGGLDMPLALAALEDRRPRTRKR